MPSTKEERAHGLDVTRPLLAEGVPGWQKEMDTEGLYSKSGIGMVGMYRGKCVVSRCT